MDKEQTILTYKGKSYVIGSGDWLTISGYCFLRGISNVRTVMNWVERGVVPCEDCVTIETLNKIKLIRDKEYNPRPYNRDLNKEKMEKFRVVHYNNIAARNRLEQHMIEFGIEFLKQPMSLGIEEVREEFLKEVDRFRSENSKCGSVMITNLYRRSGLISKPHVLKRGFSVVGRGRNTPSLSITEQFERDTFDGFKIYQG